LLSLTQRQNPGDETAKPKPQRRCSTPVIAHRVNEMKAPVTRIRRWKNGTSAMAAGNRNPAIPAAPGPRNKRVTVNDTEGRRPLSGEFPRTGGVDGAGWATPQPPAGGVRRRRAAQSSYQAQA